MTHDEILKALYDETMVGNKPAVLELTQKGLDEGLTPSQLLFDALIPSLEEVGARFERGDFFVPEMLIAGKAMSGALDILRPLLAQTGAETIGTFLMGTVKGDVHDIGKNLVNIMLEGAGFEVIDIGVQAAPEKFIAGIEETPDPEVKRVLNQVCDLYALSVLETDRGWFLGRNRISSARSKAITQTINRLCGELRPRAADLVTGLGIPDDWLGSAMVAEE